jgi:hypothetical protein
MNQHTFCKTLLLPEKVKEVQQVIPLLISLLTHFSLIQPLRRLTKCNTHTPFHIFIAPLCLTRKSARQGTAGLA